MERTETGYRLRCECGHRSCTVTLDVDVFPQQDTVVLGIDAEHPFRLSELRAALAETAPAPATTGNPRCGWCTAEGHTCPAHADTHGTATARIQTEEPR